MKVDGAKKDGDRKTFKGVVKTKKMNALGNLKK